jgi:lipopolysaccharide transport system permease protein
MSPTSEAIKYGLPEEGVFSLTNLAISFTYMLVLLFVGIITFHKVEKSFMDTV